MGMKLGRAMGLGTGSSEGGSVRRESPSVSWGHPTSAVPAQCSAPRLSAAGEGMSCSGLCSVQLPSQFWEPGLISALVTAGRSAGSSAKPRLVQPGATASRCVQQFKESLFFVFFFPSSPWEVLHNPGQVPRWWLWLLRGHQMPLPARSGHAAGRSRHCCSIPALLAASWCLVQHRLVPCFFSFPAAPTGMRDIPRTHT